MENNKILAFAGVAACAGAVGYLLGRGSSKSSTSGDRVVPMKSVSTDFDSAFPKYLNEFVEYLRTDYNLEETMLKRVQEMCTYTCLGGKGYRGGLVASSTQTLCEANGLNFEDYKEKSYVLGWCIEILQAMFLVADDIMDASVTRRGKPCWYRLEQIQLDAVNDSLILESVIYFLLDKYFNGEGDSETVYLKLLEVFRETTLQTEMGQMLDLVSQPQGRQPRLEDFNLKLYTQIVTYKTAFYTFYLPISSALIMMGFASPENLKVTREVCIAIGVKFQIQDDYLDCYGDPEKIGKIGTDIMDHKCSWLCVQALERMTNAQLALFKTHYGKHAAESEKQIKQLYKDLDLESLYLKQEESSLASITNMINSLPSTVPHTLFLPILKKIHLRQK